jgi:hypothetical protein
MRSWLGSIPSMFVDLQTPPNQRWSPTPGAKRRLHGEQPVSVGRDERKSTRSMSCRQISSSIGVFQAGERVRNTHSPKRF